MKVIVDTNVLVSGIFFKDTPFQILLAWKNNKFKLVTTHEIFEEYKRVITELSEQFSTIEVSGIIEKIAINSVFSLSINLSRTKVPKSAQFRHLLFLFLSKISSKSYRGTFSTGSLVIGKQK